MREQQEKSCSLREYFVIAGVFRIIGGCTGKNKLSGDLLAQFMTAALAGVMCIHRRYPATPARGSAFMMAIFLLPAGLLFD